MTQKNVTCDKRSLKRRGTKANKK